MLTAQNRARGIGEFEHTETVVGYIDQAPGDQLAQQRLPGRGIKVATDAEGGQPVVTALEHPVASLAAQHVDDIVAAIGNAPGLPDPVDAGQQPARRVARVPALGRIQAVVAVAAGAAVFTEIAQQTHSPAIVGLGEPDHRVELLARRTLVLIVGR